MRWNRNLVSSGTTSSEQAARLRAAMEKYFPEALATDQEPLAAATAANGMRIDRWIRTVQIRPASISE
jgi:hypothetical protein